MSDDLYLVHDFFLNSTKQKNILKSKWKKKGERNVYDEKISWSNNYARQNKTHLSNLKFQNLFSS